MAVDDDQYPLLLRLEACAVALEHLREQPQTARRDEWITRLERSQLRMLNTFRDAGELLYPS